MPNPEVTEYLKGRKLTQSMIISCPSQERMLDAAVYIAATKVCSDPERPPCGVCQHCRKAFSGIHPDIITIDRDEEKNDITVDQIRQLVYDASVLPNEAENKVYIIRNAGAMNQNAQNALLKVLEEPPARVSIILLAENPGELLQTIRSRCALLLLPPERTDAEPGKADELASALLESIVKEDKYAVLARIWEINELPKNELRGFLDALDRHAVTDAPKLSLMTAELSSKAKTYLDFNLGAGYISGLFMSQLL